MAQTFEEYVTEWDNLVAEKTKLEAKLKPLKAKELEMRKAIEKSLLPALGDNLKEGVNKFSMADGRVLKYTHSIKRDIETGEIENARKAYAKQNDAPIDFDALLRVKHELQKREWDKLSDAAKKAVSRMIVSKQEAPKLEIE